MARQGLDPKIVLAQLRKTNGKTLEQLSYEVNESIPVTRRALAKLRAAGTASMVGVKRGAVYVRC